MLYSPRIMKFFRILKIKRSVFAEDSAFTWLWRDEPTRQGVEG